MNTYLVNLKGIALKKSVAAKDVYDAAEQWAMAAPANTWSQNDGVVIEVWDIDEHLTTFAVTANFKFAVRMVPQ